MHDSEILADGQQVVTVCAFIHHNFDGIEKVFLPKRAATKKFLPGVFELPGGHVDFGENPVTALKREIHEEFGKEIKIGEPFAMFDYRNEIKKSHSFEIVYFAQFDNLENITLNQKDHSEYKWLSRGEISQIFTDEKDENDPEIKIIRRGFALLNGAKLEF